MLKRNVDLTTKDYFSRGWRTKGIFIDKEPIKTSKKFKEILKMGKEKDYSISSIVSKIFGLMRVYTINGSQFRTTLELNQTGTSNWTSGTTSIVTNGTWIATDSTF